MRQHLPMAFAAMLMACCLPSVLSQKVFPNISSAYKQLSGNANNSAPPADLLQAAVASDEAAAAGHADHEPCHLTVAGFEWSHVQNPIIIATFLFFSAITKICFHHAGYLVTKIPESCLLIVLGTIAGTIFTFSTDTDSFPEDLKTLRPDLFFLVLLPPIVLEASYSLHNRVFFDNIGSILVFAVVGTIISCFFIGEC
ncbi:hypothetical protein EB796_023747 [Bugula neritina]|uniref:Cation/H+ exchanger transmembrane domain-containing protein n=1 Tax=Bugula neritina TaxID=10212 RepID=A0A7J7IWK3_BUGNE|nr:hypothetical protein EB796_023747 [Bugula neritina]